jgi:TonB-linked SusC/RagA family outer membrane protein
MKTKISRIITTCFLIVFQIGLAQQTIKGTITDESGVPLPGATITVKGTSNGSSSDFDGNFSIAAKLGDTLVFSFVGYSPTELVIDGSQINVTLSPTGALDEVVVTALGLTRAKKSLGFAVQSVDSKAINDANENNLVNALQGQISGVQIQGSASTLGGASRITIRGSNSFLGNNQPLFVVDGVPMDNSSFSSIDQQEGFGDNEYDYGNTISDIDPASIADMTVLKGAAATALYGSRGANGVILITTKNGKGSDDGMGVSFSTTITFDEVTNLLPVQQMYGGGSTASTPSGFNELIQDGVSYLYPNYKKDGSWGPKYDPNVLVRHWNSWDPLASNYKETRPWVAPANGYETYFDTGVTYNNSISFSGANNKGNYRVGYTNIDQKGTTPLGKLEKNAISINSGYELTDKLKAGVSVNYTNTIVNNRNVTGYDNGNPMQAFTQWWQTQLDMDLIRNNTTTLSGDQYTWNAVGPVVDETTKEFKSYDFAPNYFDSPFWVRENFLQEDVRNRMFGNMNLAYEINDELSVSTQIGTDWYQFSLREGIPLGSVSLSKYVEAERRFQETNMEVKLNYKKEFSDKLDLRAFVGANTMRQVFKKTDIATSGGIVVDKFFNIANSSGSPAVSTYQTERGIDSFFASASLAWDSTVYLDLSARNDWSSTLPKDNNSYFYPSASLSFIFTEAIDLTEAVNFGKFRVSIAQAGNDASPYLLENVYEATSPNFGSNPLYRVPQSQQNPNLTNELTTEFELGLDLVLFDNRLSIDAAYYDRTTKDQIFNVPLPSPTGFTSRTLNAGEMRNWGWEFQFKGTPIKQNDLRVDLGLNLSFINNEVVELLKDNEGNSVVENIAVGSTWAAEVRVQEGYPYMALFGQDYTYDSNGNRIVDADGKYVFTSDREYLGSVIPDLTGGFSTSVEYKNFTLSTLFDFQVGGIIHSTSTQWSKYSGMHPETVAFNGESDTRANGMILPGVKADGSKNDISIDPQSYYQSIWRSAAPNVFETSYLKFRDVRLSYRFPSSTLDKTPFNNLTFGVFGRNIAILSSDLPYLDPQGVTSSGNLQGLENAQVPSTRSFGFNLTAQF